jgi:DNA-binding LytR/AlgR family response regulator
MSKKLKLALLEDNSLLLKDLKYQIEENNLAEILISSSKSNEFMEKMETQLPDALVLDIDLIGDSMSGLDVANYFKDIPILFITGNTRQYIDQIETLKINKDVPVDFLTKPVVKEKLVRTFMKLEKNIRAYARIETLNIKLLDYFQPEPIKQDEIVYIRSDYTSNSNNKKIQLTSNYDECTVSRKSMNYFFENGLSKELFIQTSQSFIINKKYLRELKIKRDIVNYHISFSAGSKAKTELIEITEEYWRNIKRM